MTEAEKGLDRSRAGRQVSGRLAGLGQAGWNVGVLVWNVGLGRLRVYRPSPNNLPGPIPSVVQSPAHQSLIVHSLTHSLNQSLTHYYFTSAPSRSSQEEQGSLKPWLISDGLCTGCDGRGGGMKGQARRKEEGR